MAQGDITILDYTAAGLLKGMAKGQNLSIGLLSADTVMEVDHEPDEWPTTAYYRRLMPSYFIRDNDETHLTTIPISFEQVPGDSPVALVKQAVLFYTSPNTASYAFIDLTEDDGETPFPLSDAPLLILFGDEIDTDRYEIANNTVV